MMYAVLNTQSGVIYRISTSFDSCKTWIDDMSLIYEAGCLAIVKIPMLMLDSWGLELLEYYNKEVKSNDYINSV